MHCSRASHRSGCDFRPPFEEAELNRINLRTVADGPGWRLDRMDCGREPMIGAAAKSGGWPQSRFVESGGVVVASVNSAHLYGPGHRIDIPAHSNFLYVPLDSVEWVLHVSDDAPTQPPSPKHSKPASDPVPIRSHPAVHAGLYPTWAEPWLGLPFDVGTWASELDIRATSLSQRTRRLSGFSAKPILTALRATMAFALADHYRGNGTELALEVGFSSHAHLSADISERFGVSLTELLGDSVSQELEWLRLLRSALR